MPTATLMAQAPAGVDTYRIDSVHSNIGFRVRHLMSKVTGRFGKVEGTVRMNPRDVAKSSVDVTIEVASVSTNDDKRDGHLKSPDFFDAAKFPTITFHSTAVKEVAKGKLEVTGSFTMKGVTRTLVLPITSLGTAVDPWKSVIAGFEGELKLNRQDYGVSYGPGLVGDEVDIDLNVEAKKVD
jgi:polyisoprenoid-binding protein YceI